MYHKYFGLEETAFSIAVNPKFLYMSEQHREALAHLLYGVKGGGFVLLSGEVGCGKTTIIRCLLQQLPNDTEIAFVLNPMADVRDLLQIICEELHTELDESSPSIKLLNDSLQKKLLENHAAGKRTVLLIDEAQLLSIDVLEQIRLLTNLETSEEKLLQIILVAQPEIQSVLEQPRLRQLSQRITARFHLQALNFEDCTRYIDHRLCIAGKTSTRAIFPKAIVKKIHKFSGGIPRLINIICERALIGAYAYNKSSVDSQVFALALTEVQGTASGRTGNARKQNEKLFIAIAALAFVVTLVIATLFFTRSSKEGFAPDQNPLLLSSNNTIANAKLSTNTVDDSTNVSVPIKTAQHLSLNLAYASLFSFHQVSYNELSHPCWQENAHNYECSELKNTTWQELETLNKPIILELISETRQREFVVLIGLSTNNITVYDSSSNIQVLERNDVATQWTGSAYYIWLKPQGYIKPISVGANSNVVSWVAKQFSILDNQDQALSGKLFNDALKTRIEHFQRFHNLEADGVIGKNTLMKLNEDLGIGLSLANNSLEN